MSSERSDYVELEDPKGRLQTIALEKAHLQIGRATTCDIRLPAKSVSKRHARLERSREGTWRIVDLGSRNGTFVNGKRVRLVDLSDGDMIGAGSFRMKLRLSEETATKMANVDLDIETGGATTALVDSDEMSPSRVFPLQVLTQLRDAVRRIGRAPDLESLLNALADEFRTALKPDRVAVGIKGKDRYDWPVVMNSKGQPADGSDLPRRLVPRVESLTGSQAIQWETRYGSGSGFLGKKGKAGKRCFVFPIKAGENRLGHVYVESRDPDWDPKPEIVESFALLMDQAGVLLEKMRFFEERRAIEEARFELTKAREVQLNLFPSDLNLDPRLDIAGRNHPAFSVSGDYYDCQRVSPGKVAFIIADVVGHGMAAAITMTRLQAAFRMAVGGGYDLKRIDQQLDDVMHTAGGEGLFATGVVGLCDVEHKTLSLVSAGHHWPSIFCGGEVIEKVDSACSHPWGVSRERRHLEPATVPFRGGWSLLAFTDGIVEAKAAKGKAYSVKRLTEFHGQNLSRDAEDLCERVLDDVLAHADPWRPPDDDMTLLAICGKEVKPEP